MQPVVADGSHRGASAGAGRAVTVASTDTVAAVADDARAGSEMRADGSTLLFETELGLIAAPLQHSDVQLTVTGHIVRARITQTWLNPDSHWVDGVYQFPLPEDSAVDTLPIRAGDREIEGRIEPKAIAAKAFDDARRNGQRAALVAQQRPNVFSAAVASIAPRSEIAIVLEYQQVIAFTDGGWQLHFPSVVAPRYSPARQDEVHPAEGDAAMPQAPTIIVPDSRANRMQIRVRIDAGMAITAPSSQSHAVTITPSADPPPQGTHGSDSSATRWEASLTSETLADRDFELHWAPHSQARPQASLQIERHDDDWYGLLVVAPPATVAGAPPEQPREVILVIDTSGSMTGVLPQAKRALAHTLGQLSPADRFNIIEFNSVHRALFPRSVPADARQLEVARRFLAGLAPNGGTEMLGALREALVPGIPAGHLSQVIFITDGAVDNEGALFDHIESLLGERKLFTVGIGSAPNNYFMRKAAAAGRGSFTLIGTNDDVAGRMRSLFDRIARPMLTDLRLRGADGRALDTEGAIRDAYAGEPVIHAFRLAGRPDELFIEGRRAEVRWQDDIAVNEVADRGIDRLWARTRLDALGDSVRRISHEGGDVEPLRLRATEIAMKHHLVSTWTSLVAVDNTPVRPADQASIERELPRQLPAGWSAKAVFGTAAAPAGAMLAQTDAGLWPTLLSGSLLLLLCVVLGAPMLARARALNVAEQ